MKQKSVVKVKEFDPSIGKYLLKATKTLLNGEIKQIFILKLIGKKSFQFTCLLCGVQCYQDYVCYEHINGKRHLKNLELPTLKLGNQDPNPMPKAKKHFDLLDEPLVGVEYIIDIKEINLKSGFLYQCLLCDYQKLKPYPLSVTALNVHLLGTSHRLKFLQHHFPAAFKIIKNSIVHRESEQLDILLTFVCDKIEGTFGRLMPTIRNGFELNYDVIFMQSNSTYLYMESKLKEHLVLWIGNILNIYETKRKTLTDEITTLDLV